MKRPGFCLGLLAIGLVGCVPPPPIAALGPAPVVEVFFDLGSITLTVPARTAIENAAAWAGRRPLMAPVEVVGHADAVGGPQANAAISQARAHTVAEALVREGVARGRIIVRAAGENLPVIATRPDDREPRNRRVEIIIR